MKKIKVLVSAYACEPDKGSEPGVGWNWARQIAKFAEVWVITKANNRESIERELHKNPVFNIHFVYYDIPKLLGFWKKKTRGLYLYYILWQIGAYQIAKKMHKNKTFDLVHHITFGNLWLPSFMLFLPIPFIWGPIGGGEQIPRAFRYEYSLKAKLQEFIRDIILITLKINPLFLYSCKRASSIITRTKESLSKIPKQYRHKTRRILETGVDFSQIINSYQSNIKNYDQVIFVGRLIHCKGIDLALKAFARVLRKKKHAKLLVIGDGPERKRLQEICREETIVDSVCFKGQVSHDEVNRSLSESSLFLFPSLKEGGSWALFEAMLLGLPIICMDIAGPTEIVNEECGIKIIPQNPAQVIDNLAKVILKILNNREQMQKMGEKGRQRIIDIFSWDKKGEFIKKIYNEVLRNRK